MSKNKTIKVNASIEDRMRVFANVMIDKIIEDYKKNQVGHEALLTILTGSLKILHPFMPFITEEIYQQLPLKNKQKCLMVETWNK